jgi:hypothetical protein
MRETIERLGAGFFAADAHEAEQAVLALFERFNRGEFRANANAHMVQTSESLARQFSRCLDTLFTKQPGAAFAARVRKIVP